MAVDLSAAEKDWNDNEVFAVAPDTRHRCCRLQRVARECPSSGDVGEGGKAGGKGGKRAIARDLFALSERRAVF